MRTTDSEWADIQAEVIGPMSFISAFMTPMEYGIIEENTTDDKTLELESTPVGVYHGVRHDLYVPTWNGILTSLEYEIDSFVGGPPHSAAVTIIVDSEIIEHATIPWDVGRQKVTFANPVPLSAGGTFRAFFDFFGATSAFTIGFAASTDDTLVYAAYGAEVENLPASGGWLFDNDTQVNAIEARILSEFDPLRATLPIDTIELTVENGVPDSDYNFLGQTNQSILTSQALRLGLSLGYEDNLLDLASHRLAGIQVSQDDLYVTIKTEGLWGRLDNEMFYGGRYDANGIDIETLVGEVLEGTDVRCTVDAAIDTLVYIPIPVVTKREALVMLAAYAGAYLIPRSDGSLEMSPTLTFYTDNPLTPFRIYDPPKITEGRAISTVKGGLFSYSAAASATTIYDGDILLANTDPQEVTIIHDPCAEGSLSLSGGSVSGTPVYNTYSTTFTLVPSGTTVGVTLTGKKVEILERAVSKTYLPVGDTVDLRCPIASDPTILTEMFDRVAQTLSEPQFEFRMRDDASYEVGDRLYLTLASARAYDVWNYVLTTPALSELVDVPLKGTVFNNAVPIVITRITREFNGATDAEVVARLDINPPV